MNLIRLGRGQYWGETLASARAEEVWVTWCRYESGVHVAEHAHEYPGIFFLISGDHVEEDSTGSTAQPPLSALWHGRDHAHETRIGPSGMVGLNVSFSSPELRLESSRLEAGPETSLIGVRLLAALRSGKGAREIQDLSYELLAALSATISGVPEWLASVHARVRDEFQNSVSLSQLAESVGVHPIYLARCYRERYGRSITQHKQELRLGHALRLAAKGWTFGQAAHDAGFSDQAHFSRLARRFLGRSAGTCLRLDCR